MPPAPLEALVWQLVAGSWLAGWLAEWWPAGRAVRHWSVSGSAVFDGATAALLAKACGALLNWRGVPCRGLAVGASPSRDDRSP